MDKKDKLIQDLITMNRKLMEKIVFLEARVVELEKRLARFENPKNSRNSSVPLPKMRTVQKRHKVSGKIPTRKAEASPAIKAIPLR